ncbi:MAG: hypothetical protein B6241_12025 [Spirochaetaceae bacterium 4572_59]|nr:MAG: hypothetical protein B6241_12025 [Spirochaetaceae bacterium 4572_59]
MNLIYEIVSISMIYLAGSLLGRLVPVPASLMSMGLFFILLVSGVMKADRFKHLSTIIPKSITNPLGLILCETLGGVPSVTVIAVVITGVTTVALAALILFIFTFM